MVPLPATKPTSLIWSIRGRRPIIQTNNNKWWWPPNFSIKTKITNKTPSKWWTLPTLVDPIAYRRPSLKPNWESNGHLEEPATPCQWIRMICLWATQLIILPLLAGAISSTRLNIRHHTRERSQSPIMELWHRCKISMVPWTLVPSLVKVLITVVEITQPLVEAENQLQIAMLIHSTSLIRPTIEASSQMVADPSAMALIKALTLAMVKRCKTTVSSLWTNRITTSTWAISALALIPPHQDSIIQTSRPNLQITWWTRLSPDSNRAYRITIDLRLALWTQIIIKATTASFKTISCCQKQVQMRVCWKLSIIVNSLRVEALKTKVLPMGSATYQIIYTLNIVTQPRCRTLMGRKELFKVWRCTYERRATVQCLRTNMSTD